MADQPQKRRARRRVQRPSPAENIDRTADTPWSGLSSADGDRVVVFEDENSADEPQTTEEFLRSERPPHYGA